MGKDITSELIDFNPSELADDDVKYITIENDTNKNVLAITNNSVSCIESNCPDKICVHKGKITKDFDNDMIVCMPHGLILYYN